MGVFSMVYQYKTKGTCSRTIKIETEGDTVKSVKFEGGCHGNLQGIGALVEGMKIQDVTSRLSGIRCGFKPTSCPDQLAKALQEVINNG